MKHTRITRTEAVRFAREHGFMPLPSGYRWFAVSKLQSCMSVGVRFLIAGDDGLRGIVGLKKRDGAK